MARIRELPTPTDKWEQELQCFVHDRIQMTFGRFGVNLSIGASPVELEEGIKAFLKWYEEFNLSMFNDLITDEELTKYIKGKYSLFNEYGEAI